MHATPPVWLDAPLSTPHFPALESRRELHVDVAIIGAGITGLTCAVLLKRAGKKVAVLEARSVGSGVTLGTSGHLTQVLDTRYHQLERDFGREGAQMAAASSGAAIDLIEQLSTELGGCGFQRVDGWLFAEREEDERELLHEHEAAVRAGLTAQLSREAPLPFPVRQALRVSRQALFNPAPYLAGLARLVHGGGSFIFEHTALRALSDGEPCEVQTSTGATLLAHEVVLATHAPLNRLLLQTKLGHAQSYVVSGPAEGAPLDLFWDLRDPYHYIRGFDGPSGRQRIIGGEDHRTGKEPDTRARFASLTDYAARFGVTPDHFWSAQVVEPVDGLPLIGRNPHAAHGWVGTGYSGTGLTFGTLAARLISEGILGQRTPWHELYEPRRLKPVAALPDFLSTNVEFPIEWVRTALGSTDVDSVRDIPRGEGRVVKVDGARLAVYRDPQGALHAVSALCTHLGCRVAFNAAETTWDCPCHGARYTTDGEVLCGPALEPLAPHAVADD